MAICLLLTDQAALREDNRVMKPAAYFNAMIGGAKKGEMHLHNSIFGILKRENTQLFTNIVKDCNNLKGNKIMHVSLTPELEDIVKKKVESGLYNNASEVVREALRFMELNQELVFQMKLDRLRSHLATSEAEIAQGQGSTLKTPQETAAFFSEIKGDA